MRPRPSYSSVTSTLALFVALSGGAYAAAKLPASSVGTPQIKNNAVTKAKIKSNSIDSSKVAADALTGADVKEASLAKVPSATLADNATTATNATHAAAAAAIDKLTYKSGTGKAPEGGLITTASAACEPPQHVIGGGVTSDVPVGVLGSFPDGDAKWTARVFDLAETDAAFTVYAVCTSAATVG